MVIAFPPPSALPIHANTLLGMKCPEGPGWSSTFCHSLEPCSSFSYGLLQACQGTHTELSPTGQRPTLASFTMESTEPRAVLAHCGSSASLYCRTE